MRVVRELTASRSKLVAGKSIMAERFAELQVGSPSGPLLSVTASLQTSPRPHACASEFSKNQPDASWHASVHAMSKKAKCRCMQQWPQLEHIKVL